MATFRKGESVRVWSNSKQAWLPGTVAEAAAVDCVIDGYSIPAGAIKVSSSAGIKWIMPDMIAASVQRVPHEPQEPLPIPASPAAGPKCRFCPRPVQPGLTKGMKHYTTCCRLCATTEGRGGHDKNCGGARPAAAAALVSGGTEAAAVANPKAWLEELLCSEARLRSHADLVFLRAAGSGSQLVSAPQLRVALEQHLLEPIGMRLQVSDAVLADLLQKFDTAGRGALDVGGFRLLCRSALESRREAWFPPKLFCWPETFVRKNPARLEEVYELGQLLGEGSFGSVYRVKHRTSGQQRVCKRIQKKKGKAGLPLEDIIREIESMAMLDHPNVIKVYEYFEDADSVTQIMEPCNGGELQGRIDEVFTRRTRAHYGEDFVCDVMKQTLRALAFMHGRHYIHKDLKPQNIMLVDEASSSVKLIDFGLAELFPEEQKAAKTFQGTLLYMAPEVFRMKLTRKSDVWSAGVILYNLITGDYPFMAPWPPPAGRDQAWWQAEVKKSIEGAAYAKHPRLATAVSGPCVDLLGQMLRKDEAARPDAATCLLHPWFSRFDESPPSLSVGVTQCLIAYSRQPGLKQAIFLVIAHQCTAPALQELRAIFTHFDVSNTGSLGAEAFREVLRKSGIAALQVERVLHALDSDGGGTVGWTEFIAAALCISACHDPQFVAAAFAMLDQDRGGRITARDLEVALAPRGGGAREEAARARWKKHLPLECAKIAPGGDERHAGRGSFTKEDFEKYVGQQMSVEPGDRLCAV